MRRIHKGSFYKSIAKGEVVVISTQEIERVSSVKYLFEGVVLVDTLNPENVGSVTTLHAYNVARVNLKIEIEKI